MDGKKIFKTEELTQEALALEIDSGIEPKLDLNAPVSAHIHAMTHADWRRQAMEDYQECTICGSELMFTHVTHFVNQETTEEAYCPSCRVRIRTALHRLQ